MKKLLLLFLLLVVALTPSRAQMSRADSTRIANYINKVEARREKSYIGTYNALQKPHQFRLGVAIVGPVFPTYSLEYTYRLDKVWEVGGSLSYGNRSSYNEYAGWDDYGAGPTIGSRVYFYYPYYSYEKITRQWTVGGSLYGRASWFRRPFVSLYTSLGLNVTYVEEYNSKQGIFYGNTSYSDGGFVGFIPVMFDFVPFGIRIGGDIFGYIEPFGYSNRGYVMMCGMGIRF